MKISILSFTDSVNHLFGNVMLLQVLLILMVQCIIGIPSSSSGASIIRGQIIASWGNYLAHLCSHGHRVAGLKIQQKGLFRQNSLTDLYIEHTSVRKPAGRLLRNSMVDVEQR